MALVDEDDVEIFNGYGRVVLDAFRIAAKGIFQLGQRGLFQGRVQLFATQDRVEALDGGDANPADVVEVVAGQALHVVQLAQFAAVVRGNELLELAQGLPPQVAAVHQKEDTPGVGQLNQPVDDIDRGEGFTAAGGHLDQGAGLVRDQRLLQVGDGLDLGRPQGLGEERVAGQMAQAAPQGIVETRFFQKTWFLFAYQKK